MFLTTADLAPFAVVETSLAIAMIEDAEAQAILAAPCIATLTVADSTFAAVRAIIRGAVLRWNDAGTGAVQQMMAGPFSQMIDTKQQRRGMYWPSEIVQLQQACSGQTGSKAFEVDTMPPGAGAGGGSDRTWYTPTDWI